MALSLSVTSKLRSQMHDRLGAPHKEWGQLQPKPLSITKILAKSARFFKYVSDSVEFNTFHFPASNNKPIFHAATTGF